MYTRWNLPIALSLPRKKNKRTMQTLKTVTSIVQKFRPFIKVSDQTKSANLTKTYIKKHANYFSASDKLFCSSKQLQTRPSNVLCM